MNERILIVDDEQAIRSALQGLFEDEEYVVTTAASGEEAIAKLRKALVDCVLLDIWMPGIDGLETLNRIQQIHADIPVIMMSGHATIDTAVRATRQGAFDFLEKPLSSDKLLCQVRNAIEKRRLQQENSNLRASDCQRNVELVGNHPTIVEVRKMVAQVAATHSPVLLLGPHGSGKTLAARMIHQQSDRREAALVEVNTAAIAEGQFEPLMFGCEKGALPTALHHQRGYFETAQGGTLYFDEIGELSRTAQASLLEVMQKRLFQRIGSGARERLDVRFIAGSSLNVNLLQREGLREDLFYRFNVISILLPSLQTRREDIPLLVETLSAQVAAELGSREMVRFDADALAKLVAHPWPGNIRELRNYIERCQILHAGECLTASKMPTINIGGLELQTDRKVWPDGKASFADAKEAFEGAFLRRYLDENDWNISRTAAAIGVERSQLHRKMKALDIHRDDMQGHGDNG